MALQKDIDLPSGVTASYWMIEDLSIQKKDGEASFVLAGYKNQSIRTEKPRTGVLSRDNRTIRGTTFDTLWQDVVIDKNKRVYEAVYDHIKTLPRYEDANDIIE